MTTEPKISFLMPMYNGLEWTRLCVRTLEQTVDLTPHELIFINDASTDGTAEFLAQLPPQYHVIQNAQRSSYAASINRGVAQARNEILCLINNDLIFTPGWLAPMLRAFDRFQNIGVVGNVQINSQTGKYDHMGMVFTEDAMPIHFGERFPFRPFRGYTEWQAVTSACWLIRKSVFLSVGGYNEAYRNAGFEDTELCLSLGRTGHRHYVANASVIQHRVSSSEGRHQYESQNAQYFMQRWRGHILAQLTPRDRRRCAANYIVRCLAQPSRFRLRKMRQALFTLLKCGH